MNERRCGALCYQDGAAGVVCPLSMTRCLLFELLLETLQVVNVDVGYRPVSEVAVSPMDQVIALALNHCLRFAILRVLLAK